jgi:hypothetical protein
VWTRVAVDFAFFFVYKFITVFDLSLANRTAFSLEVVLMVLVLLDVLFEVAKAKV